MPSGLAPQLPLHFDEASPGGIGLLKKYQDLAKQNLKHLLLTLPGERVMDIHFGVGIQRFLFAPNIELTYQEIEGVIRKQVERYLSYIRIDNIEFISQRTRDNSSLTFDPNFVGIRLQYAVVPLGLVDSLDLKVPYMTEG